jgi:hypothetical protein
MNATILKIAWGLAVAIFTAGGAWVGQKLLRKDVNGIGRRLRKLEVNTKLGIVASCEDRETRWRLVDLFRED